LKRPATKLRPDDGNWRMLSTREREYLAALEEVAVAAEACSADSDWINMMEAEEYAALDRALSRLSALGVKRGKVKKRSGKGGGQ
jgi:hypothetical protein